MDPFWEDVYPVQGAFDGFFAVVFPLFLLVLGLIVRSALRSRKVLRDAGMDPIAAHAELTARLARGPLATPAPSLEQRLAELDDLRRRGLITPEEHAAARAAALTGPR